MQRADLVVQIGLLDENIVTRVGVGDLRRSQAQLCLAQFHDGAAANFVARLGQIVSFGGIANQFLGGSKLLQRDVDVQPGDDARRARRCSPPRATVPPSACAFNSASCWRAV